MSHSDPEIYIHKCPEDTAYISVIYYHENDAWYVMHALKDEPILTAVVYCPFCGKHLHKDMVNDEHRAVTPRRSDPTEATQ